jgi:hypothetical protein
MAAIYSVVEAVVSACVPEFELTYARDAEGCQYAITPDTAGTPWRELHEGQRVRLEVTPPPVRTLRAERLTWRKAGTTKENGR